MDIQEKRDRRLFESLIRKYGEDEVKIELKRLNRKAIHESKHNDEELEIIIND